MGHRPRGAQATTSAAPPPTLPTPRAPAFAPASAPASSAATLLGLAALLGAGGCFGQVERATDARYWIYDVAGGASAGLPVALEIADESDDPDEADSWEAVARGKTDSYGRFTPRRETSTRPYLPIGGAEGPTPYVRHLVIGAAGKDTTTVGEESARVIHVMLDDGAATTLHFVLPADLVRTEAGKPTECGAATEKFGLAVAYLARPRDDYFGGEVKRALVAAAPDAGFTWSDGDAKGGASKSRTLEFIGPAVKKDKCVLVVDLRDAEGDAPSGFGPGPLPPPRPAPASVPASAPASAPASPAPSSAAPAPP